MKILMINVVCGIRSTGRICTDLAEALERQGHTVKIAYGRENVPERYEKFAVRVGTEAGVKFSALQARLLDNAGFGNAGATEKFVQWIRKFDPDIIHLHVIHGYWLNVEVLFTYLRTCGKKIIWTMHDCWAFTGHCVHFDYAKCEKWKTRCEKCPEKKEYPASILLDSAKTHYLRKKDLFTGIPGLQIVVPSQWLADRVKESFLQKYPVSVIRNGIDTSVFRPVSGNLRDQYKLERKKIVLGVATSWRERKGLSVFPALAEKLGSDYQIILIGLTPHQIKTLPAGIIGIERTDNVDQLAAFYTMADVYVNASFEENYPTTNLEAISCGTPVVTFDSGGSGESAQLYGAVVPKGDVEALAEAVFKAETYSPKQFDFSCSSMIEHYLDTCFS